MFALFGISPMEILCVMIFLVPTSLVVWFVFIQPRLSQPQPARTVSPLNRLADEIDDLRERLAKQHFEIAELKAQVKDLEAKLAGRGTTDITT
jgi:hypothetical protein